MHQWNEIKSQFECDGSLRDIYILDTDVSTWNQFLSEVRLSDYPIEFTHGGNLIDLPSNIGSIKKLQESDPTTLSIFVNEIRVNCHFFITSEVEMDINPTEINSDSSFNSLIEFLKFLSNIANSNVVLTHENSQGNVILTVCS
jgi:hypothetical protein